MFTQLRNAALLSSMIPALLAGCGGSGSQGTDKAAVQNTYAGVVIDGYLQGANVFADTNRNGVFDAGEPATTTNAKGEYFLQVPADIYLPPIIVDVTETTVDADTGKPVGLPYRLTTPEGRYGLISPLTTMVKAVMDSYPGLTAAAAEEMVRAYLGLSNTYELYADYTLKSRPDGMDSTKWKQFITESGRAHNISRIAASTLGKYWQQATSRYGGQLPASKAPKLHALLAEDVLKMVAPIASSLPNDGLIDLAGVDIDDLVLSREQLDARLRIREKGATVTLAKAVAQGDLHVLPFRNAQSNYVHFQLKNGGGTNSASASVAAVSKAIAPDLSESDVGSMQANGSAGLLAGDVIFESDTSTEMVRDVTKVLRVRLAVLPIAGELQSAIYNVEWLRNASAVWPTGAAAYKMSIKTSSSLLTFIKDPAIYRTGALPNALLECCDAKKTTTAHYRLGDLGLKFTKTDNAFSTVPTGTIELTSFAGGIAKPLEKPGSWNEAGGLTIPAYFDLKLPEEYQAELKDAGHDQLFSAIGGPVKPVLAMVEQNRYTLMWLVPAGRHTEVLALNDVAFNALKANLKW